MTPSIELQVDRTDIRRQRVVSRDLPDPSEGQVLISIDRFAFTANNVTYAAFGDAMAYWKFFPTGEDGWGIVPVWGFGDVVASRCDGVSAGERIYGYFPMSTHVLLQPVKVSGHGFADGAPHRAELHAVYNQYLRTAADPSYDSAREAEQMLLRPLFTTSFLIDDFLDDNQMFGAQTIVLSSASSKTAYGTAFCLHQRGTVRVVGLTSPANVEFVRSLGCYDEVVAYDDVASLPLAPTAYIDMAGSGPIRASVHRHFGDLLTYSCMVGGTHWDDLAGGAALPGPQPALFFAPSQVAKRNADWGPAGFQERLAGSWTGFLSAVGSAEQPWMSIAQVRGAEAAGAVVAAQVEGTVAADVGNIVSMHA